MDQNIGLSPSNKLGVSVAQQKLKYYNPKNYYPIFAIIDIKYYMFGIYSENKFEEVKRVNDNSTMLFRTNTDEIFNLKMYCEKKFVDALVNVLRTVGIKKAAVVSSVPKKLFPTKELQDNLI